jgi:hypothetical protein
MTARSATVTAGSGSKVALTTLLVVVIAVAMMLIMRASPDTEPFDPRSGADDGARGLVLLLERFGADVDIVRDVPSVNDGRRVLVLQDRLSDSQRTGLGEFVRAGGVVVMADPESPLVGEVSDETIEGSVGSANAGAFAESNVFPGECAVAAVQHLRGLFVPDGVLLHTGGDPSCFGEGDTAFLALRTDGSGVLVALGDNSLFVNRYLRFADNAGLATALLAPDEGSKVSIVLGSEAPKSSADIGTGDRTLFDLIRPGVWMGLAQLGLAFVVVAWARGVRTGRPVREPEQVPIAGSELVAATGMLMQRARHSRRAAALLQSRFHRDLCAHFRVPVATSAESLDAVAAHRTGLAPGTVRDVLARDVHDHAGLLALSNRIHEISDLVLEGAER